ncbi:MAG TPA: ATP synthase subunit I [Candidatus Acidoferrum sp.]|nr:ATP synthase subunit I [Candidatus Acidoferrum sp.]
MARNPPDTGAIPGALPAPGPDAATVLRGTQTERRISWLTLTIGAATAAAFLLTGRTAWAAGIAIGSGLGWFNFRWLARGLDALASASTAQEGRPRPQVPLRTYFTALFRYALIGLTVYVIFVYLHVPLGSMVVGLCALGAAAIAASLYEILRPAP